MKFSANIADLQGMLPKVTAVIPTRSTLAQLENLQLAVNQKKLALMVTDLEISLRSGIEVASKTDGHRLVKITNPDLKTDTERDVIVPAKAVNLVAKSFNDTDDIAISFSATQIEFKNNETSILSRLIDEQYPNYEAVIPRENEKM